MKSSINIQVVTSTSEGHNQRLKTDTITVKLPNNETKIVKIYHKELSHKNESKIIEPISRRLEKVKKDCKEKSGRKLQKNATPIREGVVNIKPDTTMQDLEKLSQRIENELGIKTFQTYIHRDEGREIENTEGEVEIKINHHAHMVFDWTDKEKGSMLRLGKSDMRKLQDIVAEELQMERGKSSSVKHLPVVEYKLSQEMKRLEVLQQKFEKKVEEFRELEREKETLNKDLSHLGALGIEARRKYEEDVEKEREWSKAYKKKVAEINKVIDKIDASFREVEKVESLEQKSTNFLNPKPGVTFEEVKQIAVSATHLANRNLIALRQKNDKLKKSENYVSSLESNLNKAYEQRNLYGRELEEVKEFLAICNSDDIIEWRKSNEEQVKKYHYKYIDQDGKKRKPSKDKKLKAGWRIQIDDKEYRVAKIINYTNKVRLYPTEQKSNPAGRIEMKLDELKLKLNNGTYKRVISIQRPNIENKRNRGMSR